ncbi:hypothetical protein ACOME3_000064 [Neoechinorhynchus agilis]
MDNSKGIQSVSQRHRRKIQTTQNTIKYVLFNFVSDVSFRKLNCLHKSLLRVRIRSRKGPTITGILKKRNVRNTDQGVYKIPCNKCSGYPQWIIRKGFNRYRNAIGEKIQTTQNTIKYVLFNFVSDVSFRKLNCLHKSLLRVRIRSRKGPTITGILKKRNVRNTDQGVYKIPCNKCSGYPQWIIRKGFNRYRNAIGEKIQTTQNTIKYVLFNFVSDVSFRKLNCLHKSLLRVRIRSRKGPTITGILKKRNVRNTDQGVYKIPCNKCSLTYIGQTKQGLKKRVQQHKQACRKFDAVSAISNHQEKTQHSVGFEKAKFIHEEADLRRKLELEVIQINNNATMEGNKSNFTLALLVLMDKQPKPKSVIQTQGVRTKLTSYSGIADRRIRAKRPNTQRVYFLDKTDEVNTTFTKYF